MNSRSASGAVGDRITDDAIRTGSTWTDLITVARVRARLDADLWPVGVARAGNSARAAQ